MSDWKMSRRYLSGWVCVAMTLLPLTAIGDATIYDDHAALAVVGRDNTPGVVEPAAATYSNGVSVGSFKSVDFYDRVTNTDSYPGTMSDIVANGFLRLAVPERHLFV